VLAASIIKAINLMMEEASTSVTSVNFYQTTWHNNPEDSHLRTCCCEKLKSQLLKSSNKSITTISVLVRGDLVYIHHSEKLIEEEISHYYDKEHLENVVTTTFHSFSSNSE
jgi:hypothetical protein